MFTNYFFAYCVTTGALAIITVVAFTDAMGTNGSFPAFFVTLFICAVASIVLRLVFTRLSADRKYKKFGKRIIVISNKDLLHSL